LSPSLRKIVSFAIHEIREGVASLAGFIHFSIVMGIVLSTLYLCLSPLLMDSFIWHALLVISMPFAAGLFVDIVWRVSVLFKGLAILKYLKVESSLRRESIISHTKVMIIIILTLSNILFSWNPEFFAINSLVFIVRNILLSIIFVKPLTNTILNYDKPIHYFEIPFKLKDVIEGKAEIENIKTSVEHINDLSIHKKLSLSACVEIGVCEDVCPATSVLRPLSPRVFVRKLAILMKKKPVNGNPFEVIDKDELWSCTTCGACTYSCPIKVRHMEIILDLRRTLVESGIIDKKKADVLSSVTTYGNTFGMLNDGRNNWLEELGVKTIEGNPNCKYLLWIGCLSSFDDRQRKIVEAFIKILKKAGKLDEIAILGSLETCCGDPVRKLGDEGMFQEIALKNIELFEKHNISSIITVCPHCYNAFKNDYRELGLKDIKVVHHAEFLDMLFESKALSLKTIGNKITVHDPCYLSRYNRVTPLINTLKRIGSVRRPKRYGEKTFCCGGGGGNYWYEVPEKRRISHERLEQLLELKPDIIITFCPYCKAMLDDAAQAKEVEHLEILDAAELIFEVSE
jgi:Fe-S oxidoreductase